MDPSSIIPVENDMKIITDMAIGIAAMLPVLLSAQYAIDWHTMDAGGGFSSGGGYELGGTIGQPDVGVSSGGVHELVAGFWAFAVVVQSDDGPQLKIRYLSQTEALIYWEAGDEPAVLQRSADLAADDWEDDPGTPFWENGEYRLIVTPDESVRFYRLRRGPP
jgi:hypothetical protein